MFGDTRLEAERVQNNATCSGGAADRVTQAFGHADRVKARGRSFRSLTRA